MPVQNVKQLIASFRKKCLSHRGNVSFSVCAAMLLPGGGLFYALPRSFDAQAPFVARNPGSFIKFLDSRLRGNDDEITSI
jgi:hypothetical protein